MKALNEAYQVLHDETRRKEYDAQRSQPVARAAAIHVAPAVRDVGVYGQLLLMAHSAMTNARESFAARHPVRRFWAVQEIAFWSVICAGGYGVYLVLTAL